MRTTKEMTELILNIAKEDDRIRAVTLSGSRANKECPEDRYQDFDIIYFVKDVAPFWDNEQWIIEKFGKPILMQKPESVELIPPDRDGNYVYLMIFPDGNRIDLTISAKDYSDNGEPAILLLDKDGTFPKITTTSARFHETCPTAKLFADCCNEFHWCLNNVAKGIAREELSYAMTAMNHVRDMLILMLRWYAGAEHDFQISVGKCGKYFKKFLPGELYERFCRTYTEADYESMWEATFTMLELFGDVARMVADKLNFVYDEEEEKGIEKYIKLCKAHH